MQRRHQFRLPAVTLGLALTLAASTAIGTADAAGRLSRSAQFERIATFEVFRNGGADRTEERVAEILAASEEGLTLIYVDSVGEAVGFLDITDPANPAGLGVVAVPGEPTSVAVAGPYALAAVNTSADFVNVSGELRVFDIATRTLVHTIALGGQPDSVAVSPDGRYAAVVIENERDENRTDPGQTPEKGGLPQLPAGSLIIVDLNGAPAAWTTRPVDLTGLADFAPEDPEPEFVDINTRNIATVTLQENNHVALVNLRTGKAIRDFNAGAVDLTDIDSIDERPNLIALSNSQTGRAREPDAITWINDQVMATANEGDLLGGSRGFTLYNLFGQVRFDAGSDFEHLAVRHGHYQDRRSDAKGTEPEGIKAATFNGQRMLFVGAERAGFVAVYRMRTPVRPEFVQILPTGIGPEGLLAIPQRNLFAVASEVDTPPSAANQLAGFRSVISLYELRNGTASYPTIVSADRPADADVGAGLPIPWGALSALAADRADANTLYTAHDSFYQQSRLYTVDVGQTPAVITGETVLRKAGATVNYDVEGLVQRPGGGFWLVSEGSGSAPSPSRLNLLVEVAADGTVVREIRLPAAVEALQKTSGFEGVAVTGSAATEKVYVAFQREWTGDPAGRVRIGEFTPADNTWRFFSYPLDAKSPAFTDAWVGLSELVALDAQTFAVIERDNLIGEEAENKRLYTFSIAGLTPKTQDEGGFPLVTKTLARDILPDLKAPNGSVLDKPEGLTVAADGQVYLVTDNDGVDGSPGETQFLRLGESDEIFPVSPPSGIDG